MVNVSREEQIVASQPDLLSVGLVVPLFRSERHLPELVAYVNQFVAKVSYQVVLTLIVDGCQSSETAAREVIRQFDCSVRLIVLSRNFGVNGALRAGLANQSESLSIAFGSDLQEPLDLLVTFVNRMGTGDLDFVFGQRLKRDDPFFSRAASALYWWINRKFVFRDSPPGGFDVFACNSVAREALLNMKEARTNITSQMLWLGFRREFVGFERRARTSGRSTWTLRKKMRLFIDSIFSFSDIPFQILNLLRVLTVASLLLAISVDETSSFIALAVVTLGASLQISQFAIARIHESTRNRPLYVIQSVEEFPKMVDR